ncbi:NmrA family NAD(P)-binding protein [Phycicoccus sp. HDW14]|nr:NmrA family NAD(P)-binding protein [Phycicoccus sp. HDW14]
MLVVGVAGKTGRAVAAALRRRRVPVRGTVRPDRADDTPHGVEPAEVDLDTGDGLEAALAGCRAAYHLAPNVHPDEVGMARRFAAAATATGLPHAVLHSVLHPEDRRMPHHLRKAAAEQVLRERLPASLVVLRPCAYQENLLPQVLAGEVVLPYSPDAPFTAVALDDVAEAAAKVLLDPASRRATYDLAGPQALSTREMVEQAAEVLGRPVAVRVVTPSAWATGPGAGLPPRARDDLVQMFAAYDEDGLVGDPADLATLLGRRPTRWSETVAASGR